METNQIGTAEFVDFCRQVGADPLMSVNFESDGYPGWAKKTVEFAKAIRAVDPSIKIIEHWNTNRRIKYANESK